MHIRTHRYVVATVVAAAVALGAANPVDAVVLAQRHITFTQAPPTTATYGDTFSVVISSTGTVDAAVLSAGASSGCDYVNQAFVMTSGTVDCVVVIDVPAGGGYAALHDESNVVVTSPAAQTITMLTEPPTSAVVNTTFDIVYRPSTTGNTVVRTATDGCSFSGSPVESTSPGGTFTQTIAMTSGTVDCAVSLQQIDDADTNYAPSDLLSWSVTAVELVDAVLFEVASIPDAAVAYDNTFAIRYIPGLSSGAVSFAATGGCEEQGSPTTTGGVVARTILITSGITACNLAVSQAADGSYGYSNDTASVTVKKADQVLSYSIPSRIAYGGFVPTFVSGGNSSFAPRVTLSDGSSCAFNADQDLIMTSGVGDCVFVASQQGDDNYNAAPNVTITVHAMKRNQNSVALLSKLKRGKSFLVSAKTRPDSRVLKIVASGKCTASKVMRGKTLDSWKIKAKSSKGACTLTITTTEGSTSNFAALRQVSRLTIT